MPSAKTFSSARDVIRYQNLGPAAFVNQVGGAATASRVTGVAGNYTQMILTSNAMFVNLQHHLQIPHLAVVQNVWVYVNTPGTMNNKSSVTLKRLGTASNTTLLDQKVTHSNGAIVQRGFTLSPEAQVGELTGDPGGPTFFHPTCLEYTALYDDDAAGGQTHLFYGMCVRYKILAQTNIF